MASPTHIGLLAHVARMPRAVIWRMYAAEKTAAGGRTSQEQNRATKPRFGGKRRATRVKDKQTGAVYDSKSKGRKAPAEEFGLVVRNL